MKKVAHLVKNSCNPDWRVIKAAEAGINKGYDVTIFAMWENGVSPLEEINNVKYVRIYPKFDFFSKSKERRYKAIPSFFGDFVANFISSISQVTKFIKLTKYSSMRASSMKRLERGFRTTSKQFILDYMPDIIHCHDLETLRTGIEIKNEINSKVIFDSHEFEQNKNPPADPLTNSFIRNQERKLIVKADAVITVSEEIACNLQSIYGLKRKPIIIYNVPSGKLISNKDNEYKYAIFIDDKAIYRVIDAAQDQFSHLTENGLDDLIDDCLRNNYFSLAKKLRLITKDGSKEKHFDNYIEGDDGDVINKNVDEILPNLLKQILNIQTEISNPVNENQYDNSSTIEFDLKFNKRSISNEILNIENIKTKKVMLRSFRRFENSSEREVTFNELDELFKDFEAVGLHVGNLTVGRGIETAIRSLEMLPEHALALVGPRNNESFLRQVHLLIDRFELGKRVFFFDALEENLCDFISKFDYSLVTTLPVSKSTLYSMPNKLFESSIANVPIICSDTISASNFIKEYQRGEIYLSGNEYDLAVKIRSVTDNKEDYIYNQEDQENFVKEFSQNEQYKKMYSIYEE
jgi:glycosyltransferase involved in cell wall biosynthesis